MSDPKLQAVTVAIIIMLIIVFASYTLGRTHGRYEVRVELKEDVLLAQQTKIKAIAIEKGWKLGDKVSMYFADELIDELDKREGRK